MIFNVQNFGAKGDGITDDTAAIQNAIDAAAGAGGGQVYMPTGTYIVSGGEEPSDGCLMLKTNVYLYGDGMGDTTVKLADGSDTKITGIIRSAYGEETHDFGVSNLTIDGNRDSTTGKVDGWFNGYIPGEEGYDSNVTLDSVEREFILMTLTATQGNKKDAAQQLGISRRALYDKLKKHGLL